VSDYLYHPESDPDGNSIPSISPRPLANDTGGYLFAVIQDNRTSPRRRSTAPLTQIRTERYYDPAGNLVRAVDGRGADTLFEVNALNQVVQRQSRVVTTGSGPKRYRHVYFYDASNNLIQEDIENVDANGPSLDQFVTYTYSYDLLDKRTQKTEEAGTGQILVTSYAYDQNENLVRITQPEGNVTEIAYDERDLRYAVTRGAGTSQASTRTFTYDGSRNLIRATDATDRNGDGRNEETLLFYDGYDRLVRSVDAVGSELRLRYNPANRRVREQRFGRNGGPSPTDNSGAGNVLLSEVETLFDELHREFQRDAKLFSNLAPVGPEGPLTPGDGKVTTRLEHDRNSRLTRHVDDNAHQRRFEYDGVDRLIRSIDALNNEQRFAYDGNHNLVQTSETERSPEGLVPDEQFTTQREFDAVDRLIRVIDNLTNTVSFAYDSRNNVTRKTDALANTTIYVHDGLNRLLVERVGLRVDGTGASAIDTSNLTNPDGQITTLYGWDRNSRLTSLADDNGNFTRYAYDALNRRTVETFADQTTRVYDYDRDDNVIRYTDNAGNIHSNRYDALDRLVAKDVARAPGVEGTTQWRFEYDGLSRRTKMTDNNDPASPADDILCEFRYDSLNRLLTEVQGSRQVSSVFDGVGNRLSLQYSDGRVVETTRDALDRIKFIRDQGSPANIAEYKYLGAGRVLERGQGNGTKLRFHDGAGHDVGYDQGKRRVEIDYRRGDNSVIAGFTHAFDRENNRRFERDVFKGTADVFEYDSAYRVTRAAFGLPQTSVASIANNSTINADVAALSSPKDSSYLLDGVGNWRQRTRDGGVTNYTVNVMNEYAAIGGVAQTNDLNGNLTTDGSKRYIYDFVNRLVRVTPSGSTNTMARYVYDAAGRRLMKIVGATTTEFVYDRAHEIEERENGVVVRQYVFGRNLDEMLELKTGGNNYYYQQNFLGSVVALTDAGGAVIERYTYREYGDTVILDGGGVVVRADSIVGNPYRYTGRRFDDECGLYYYRARHFSAGLGRFLQRDPKVYLDGPGWHAFTAGNPVNATDPFGTERKKSEPGLWEWLDQFTKAADDSKGWSWTTFLNDLNGWKVEQIQDGLKAVIEGQGQFVSDIGKTFDNVEDHAKFLLEQGKIFQALRQQKYWVDLVAGVGTTLGRADTALAGYNLFFNPSVPNDASHIIDFGLGLAGEAKNPVIKTSATALSIGKWVGEETPVWAVPGYWMLLGMGYSEDVALEAVLDTFGDGAFQSLVNMFGN
jgi:RHS repeat-associated protein